MRCARAFLHATEEPPDWSYGSFTTVHVHASSLQLHLFTAETPFHLAGDEVHASLKALPVSLQDRTTDVYETPDTFLNAS